MSDAPEVRTADQIWDPVYSEWVDGDDYREPVLYKPTDRSPEAMQSRQRELRWESHRRADLPDDDPEKYGNAFSSEEMDKWRADMGWAGEKVDPAAEILGIKEPISRRVWRDEKPHDPAEEILRDPNEVVADLVVASDYIFSVNHSTYASSASWSLSFVSDPSITVDLSGIVYPIGRSKRIRTSGVRVWYTIDETAVSGPESEKKVSPEVNRKRHGKSAVCPRHGETRGGLCRKCR